MQNQKKNKYDEFIYSLKDPFFDNIFKQLNERRIRQKTEEENVDLYLLENVLPVLFSGLEELSKEIERFQKDETIDLEIRSRFNPLLFLGQYMMRNNPRYEQSNEILRVKQHLRKEKIKRYLILNQQKFLEIFQKSMNKQTTNCLYSELHLFTEKIDDCYKFDGEFTKFLLGKKEMIKSKEMKQCIKFEDILMSIVEFTKEDCTVEDLKQKYQI